MPALFELYADWTRYLLAVIVALLPQRWWSRFEAELPIRRAAAASGLVTAILGFALSVGGFLNYAARATSERNAALLKLVAEGRGTEADQRAMANYGLSSVVLFEFLFFTPLGLFAMYLTASGTLRGFAGWSRASTYGTQKTAEFLIS